MAVIDTRDGIAGRMNRLRQIKEELTMILLFGPKKLKAPEPKRPVAPVGVLAVRDDSMSDDYIETATRLGEGDPFLAVSAIGMEMLVIEKWDEPNFRG